MKIHEEKRVKRTKTIGPYRLEAVQVDNERPVGKLMDEQNKVLYVRSMDETLDELCNELELKAHSLWRKLRNATKPS